MPNYIAIPALAALSAVAIYFLYKGLTSRAANGNPLIAVFLFIGMVAGFLGGGYLSYRFIPLSYESDITPWSLFTGVCTVIGGLLGAYLATRFSRRPPNHRVKRTG